ncbi:peroxidase [Marinobacter nanhaiticus D15-8W]|uniref:Dyp-type peroxidase n=1 Tax=Marinobacter nanhaiticus D15-8W TaxID=626887 RepID=N6WW41_9GAMM|nr:Dyp-type peroxidase [Marinobacter nanhaiticus]ENO13058.1 Dyp-type peroxidase [Marinobacter nanhaiticus D15-8W]BES70413.1 peroxidase [Marinobacter nanhaiticus D15-8W]
MDVNGRVDFGDIQGLVVRGYGHLHAASYLLLRITDRPRSQAALRDLAGMVTYADLHPDDLATNLAVTHHGLVDLGIEQGILERFSNEFRSGMTTPHKRRILGDVAESAPEHWLWGGPETTQVDLLLMVFARDDALLKAHVQRLQDGIPDQGLELIAHLETFTLPDFREHFGFRDSIGQPYVAEFGRHGRRRPDPVPLGEFLLGYPNGYERYTDRPLIEPGEDPHDMLPPDPEGSSRKDLGLNGTYLVFRQLSQDVPGFWRAMMHQSQLHPEWEPIQLASKMVGRWPSGTALVQSPDKDRPEQEDKDDFLYHDADAEGLKCPLGAHIRRTHPRDSLEPEPGSEKSIAFSNRHRLLRRGRVYGPPYDISMDPSSILKNLEREDEPVARGLHFICLNANIGRQFEFVQHTWANNPNFNGLHHDPDPIIGARTAYGRPQEDFTIQRQPARCRLQGLPSFIQTRGGGYFFLPGRRALHYLLSGDAS